MPIILIVDDDPSTLGLLEAVFLKDGYQVLKASGGRAAVALARRYKPQLILLDFMMPDMDGASTCHVLRQDPEIRHIPIIMLTAARSIDNKLHGLESGADEYLTKPVHPAELRTRVRLMLNRHSPASQAQPEQEDHCVFAVFGASGGAGTSTIALNLAASIVDEYPDTVLAELVPDRSEIAMQLGLGTDQPGLSWSSLSPQNLNGENLQKFLLSHPSGLKILPGEADLRAAADFEDLRPDQIQQVIRQLSGSFRYVFLDMGRGFNNRVQAAQPFIHHYIQVVRADARSLSSAIQQVRLLVERGLRWDQLHLALVASAPQPFFLDEEKSRQILKACGMQDNLFLFMPPMHDLIRSASERKVPLVLLNPEAQSYRLYFKDAIRQLLLELKPAVV